MEPTVHEATHMNIRNLLTQSLLQLDINNATLSLPYDLFRHGYALELQGEPKQLLTEALVQLKTDFLILKTLKDQNAHQYAFKKRQIISSHALNLSKLQAKNNFNSLNPAGE